LACEVEPEPLSFIELAAGIDVGLESFATPSNGLKIENRRFFRHDEKELAQIQRKLSKAEKGTPERARRREPVQHVHQRIAIRRKDFAHQLSRELVEGFGMIAFEHLHIKNLLQSIVRQKHFGCSLEPIDHVDHL
jgi:putative transposase